MREKFGVDPESIPDYLALVGDSADGFPGLPGWGAKSAAAVLGRYGHIEAIPDDPRQWDVTVRSAAALAETLQRLRDVALHFRVLATLRVDAEVGAVDDWEWNGTGRRLRGMERAARLRQPRPAHRRARGETEGLGMTLEGRVALVTGGGRGIGRAISLGLAADGAAVAVNFRRDEASALATVEEITAAGGRAAAFAASIDVYEDDEQMVAAVREQLGPVDLLVNNAGVASRGLTVADTDPSEPDRLWRTHAFGAWALSKLVLPDMRKAARGDIVMISSAATVYMARSRRRTTWRRPRSRRSR